MKKPPISISSLQPKRVQKMYRDIGFRRSKGHCDIIFVLFDEDDL